MVMHEFDLKGSSPKECIGKCGRVTGVEMKGRDGLARGREVGRNASDGVDVY